MPKLRNGILVVTKDELVPEFYSWPNLKVTLHRYKNKEDGIKRAQLGGNGRQLLIYFDTLSEDIQMALGDPRKASHPFEKFYKKSTEDRQFFSAYKLSNGALLPIEAQERLVINAATLRACNLYSDALKADAKKKNLKRTGFDETICNLSNSFNDYLKNKYGVEHSLPQSLKRFKIVLKDFENKGAIVLINGKYGNNNSRKLTDRTMEVLKFLFSDKTYKPTPIEVCRTFNDLIDGKNIIINTITGEQYDPKEFKKLSTTTVNKFLSSWDVMVGVSLTRQGDRQKQMGGYKPYVSFQNPTYSNTLISVDDRQPPFAMANNERIWLYVAYDIASEFYICVVHGKTKEGLILDFYRQLLRNIMAMGVGMPIGLECESSLNSQFVNTFLQEGVMFEDIRIEANNARGKKVESANRQMRYQIEKKHANFISRPFARNESNQAGTNKTKPMLYNEIVEQALQDYKDWNNEKHSKNSDLTRHEYFLQNQHPECREPNFMAILPYLGKKTETSCNVGSIRFRSDEYWLGEDGKIATGERLIALMRLVEGHNVTIYWLDDDMGNIIKALVFMGTRPICEAIKKPKIPRAKVDFKPEHMEIEQTVFAYINTITSYGKQVKNSIESVTIINNNPKPKGTYKIPGLKSNETLSNWGEAKALPDLPTEDDFINKDNNISFVKPLRDTF
jgi:hypothetical protein